MRLTQCLTIGVLWLSVFGQAALAQSQQAIARATTVAELLKDLRWHDNPSHDRYLDIRAERMQSLLSEIDGFVTETFSPGSATAVAVQDGLDALLGHKRGNLDNSVAFLSVLPVGRFLVVGVEIRRGGGALSEDAFSFRAYKDTGTAFAFIAETRFGTDVEFGQTQRRLKDWEPVAFLNAKAVPAPPISNQFWFVTWAVASHFAPPVVAVRLYAFDGERFRTIWTPKDFVSESSTAVTLTADGLTVRKLIDSTGGTPGSPTVVVRERYALTADGPQKVLESETCILDEPK
jgi:hypothetical protein